MDIVAEILWFFLEFGCATASEFSCVQLAVEFIGGEFVEHPEQLSVLRLHLLRG